MSEFIFILSVIFVAYVIYRINDSDGQNTNKKKASSKLFKPPVNIPEKVTAKPDVTKKSPAKKAEPVKAKKKIPTSTPKIELRTVVLKHPATGEEAKVASNYRMAKRWVKEALVEEKLLDKIYKTNEMDDAAKAKVAEALSIIKAMDKYQV